MRQPLIKFRIQAVNAAGNKEVLELSGVSEEAVVMELVRNGLTPLAITPVSDHWWDRLNKPLAWDRTLRLIDIARVTEQLAQMLQAGLTLEKALTVIGRQRQHKAVKSLVERLLLKLAEGRSLSEALADEPGIPHYLIGIVLAAEQSGRLSEGLSDAARYFERQLDARRRVVNALAYPTVVFLMIGLSLVFILGFVIPEFQSIFAGEEQRLPKLTRFILFLSDLLTRHYYLLITVIVGVPAVIGALLHKSHAFKAWLTYQALRFSIVRLALMLDLANVLAVLGSLLSTGVDASDSLRFAAQAASSSIVKTFFLQAAQTVREGTSIVGVLNQLRWLPETTLSIIEIGEHTGTLGATTLKASALLENETLYKIDRLITLLNPLAIALLGILVGFVISGVMLGIMSINQLMVH
ncbi:MAG: type II secretion system F family protein [Gammaproteobacteria bacterium]